MNRRLPAALSLTTVLLTSAVASAQDPAGNGSPQPTALELPSRVTAVTLYRGRAAVTRTATARLERGLYEITIAGLPEALQPDTLQARPVGAAGGGGLRVLAVELAAALEPDSPELAARDAEIAAVERQIADVDRRLELLASEWAFLDALATRTASETGQHLGGQAPNVTTVRELMSFISSERERIGKARLELTAERARLAKQLAALQQQRAAMAGGAATSRAAMVTLAALEATDATIELSYLVGNATWEPAYSVRAAADSAAVVIEYDAMLTQRTGEDWTDVKLTLSTAQPALATNPPALQPWYVDIQQPVTRGGRADDQESEALHRESQRSMILPRPGRSADLALEELSSVAVVSGEGPAVTFTLPRPVTVPTNLQRQQRTRIAAIDARSERIHVAVPLLTEAVYTRADVVNASAFQLLPGRAAIFIGQSYIGPTALPAVAPQGEFELYLGIDPAVKARRQLVTKNTDSTGLLGGGRRTEYDYRLELDNGTGKAIVVELWDRYPVSRTEQIQVELRDLNVPLATDREYVNEQKPQGLLKWLLSIPATARDQAASAITYRVRIDRAKDVEMTELPE